jgi:pimeloyl-ACP methyl ester carboxylesterase
MSHEIDNHRRQFLGVATLSVAATQLGVTAAARSAEKPPTPPASGKSLGAVKQVDAGVLNVGYVEDGPADGTVVILLHGWPYDIHSYGDVVPLLVSAGYRVIVPYLRGYGTTRFLANETVRSGQQAAMAVDVIAFMDALKIKQAVLAGFDWGSRAAISVAALWPERCKAVVAVSGYIIINVEMNKQPLSPAAELGWWYQYYFATERGRLGYEKNRHDFAKLIWKIASPKWAFDNATFDRSAAAFDNPDHVSIVIHNYRWRLGLENGEARYEEPESKLQQLPVITVPTVTIGSDFDGAAADGKAYAAKFAGKHLHRVLNGVGHNVPQEAPQAFAQAIGDVDRLASA